MKTRFYRIQFQDNKKDLTEETRPNLGTPWFTSSSVPGLGHLTAVFIQLSVMNSSQPGQPFFQLFFSIRKGISRVKRSVYESCQDSAVFQIYGGIFRKRTLKLTIWPS